VERKKLKNPPLVEAIFELRWELEESDQRVRIDPHYEILIGRIYDRVANEYPFHEPLPTANIPDEIAAYVVQHRFRKDKNEWPLIQIGPGIITLNDTEGYVWSDFKNRISHLLSALYEAYPKSESNFRVKQLLLRYINAIEFDYESENLFDFLREKLKVTINIPEDLFEKTDVNGSPLNIDLRFAFPSSNPNGAIYLRFARGKKKGLNDVLIWELRVQSTDDVPNEKEKIITWIESAHSLVHNWFFKMIEGELLRRFE